MSDERLDLLDVLAMLRRQARLIAGITIAGMIAAVVFVALADPIYTGEATLKFDPSQFRIASENPRVENAQIDRQIRSEIAVLRSPEMLRRVMTAEQLWTDPELNEPSLTATLLNLLPPVWRSTDQSANRESEILDGFNERLKVYTQDSANLITISYESGDREKSARVANAVANTYLIHHLDNQIGASPIGSMWLDERQAALREQWRRSEQLVEQFKAENNLSYVGGENLKEQQIARLNEQLVLANAAAEEARAEVEQIRQLLDSRDFTQLINVVRSENMTALRSRLAAATQRAAALSVNLLPGHPSMRQVNSEIASVNAAIESEALRHLENLEFQHRAARDREALSGDSLQRTIGTIQESGETVVKLRELERNAASDKAIYEAFLNRSKETLEQSTGELANFSLIPAEVPTRPSFPSPVKILAIALFGSFAAGLCGAILRESTVRGFRSGREAAEQLGIAHLGSLPVLNGRKLTSAELRRFPERTVARQPSSKFAGAIAMLRAAFSLAAPLPPKVVAVTSSVEGEGKTFVAASVAQSAATNGVRTLLVASGQSGPRLHGLFASPAQATTAVGGDDAAAAPYPVLSDEVSGLDVLLLHASGAPAEPGPRPPIREVLDWARSRYDFIVVDTGSVSSTAETWSLVSAADLTLLVIRWGTTPQDTAMQALRTLQRCHAKAVAAVLNWADTEEAARSSRSSPILTAAPRATAPRTIEVRGSELR